eukprot:scaffold23255_cov59-Attheya_sp.AAC.5
MEGRTIIMIPTRWSSISRTTIGSWKCTLLLDHEGCQAYGKVVSPKFGLHRHIETQMYGSSWNH